MRFPALQGSFQIRFAAFDLFWAAASPPIALYLRGVAIGLPTDLQATELFCIIAFASSVVAFLIFRIREGIAHHFSVHDALEVGKAVLVSELFTTVALFTAVRLEGIPRATPIIHALILATGLILYRVIIRALHDDYSEAAPPVSSDGEPIVVIGCTRLSSLYIRMVQAYRAQKHKIVGMLDGNPRTMGRSIDGVRVVGQPSQLEAIVQEFAEHGVSVKRVILGGDRNLLSPAEMDQVEGLCAKLDLKMDFVPALLGLTATESSTAKVKAAAVQESPADIRLPLYFRFKRGADVAIGLVLLVLLSPLMVLTAGIVLLDIGSPVLFWQQRVGLNGRPFLLYKFRTLKPLFNERGLPIGTSDRISWAGTFIRQMRLDELPQLLSVLVGDMSLIGPRPLLLQDQPSDPTIRLMVKPGVTGWAQVNGGKSLSAEKKNEFDEWYIRNASFWLDLRILLMTLGFIWRGEISSHDGATVTRTIADSPQSHP